MMSNFLLAGLYMPSLTLWTVRPKSDFTILQQEKVYHTNEQLVASHRLQAYYWMAEQLQKSFYLLIMSICLFGRGIVLMD